ncbi:hypothetical protein JHK82_040774 [Glycine max]|nr:hypothetical protein JHK82_040774 [Glycine max]
MITRCGSRFWPMQEALDWTQPGLSFGPMAHGAFVPHPIGPEDFGAELDTGHDRSACEDFQNPEYCCSDAMPHPPHASLPYTRRYSNPRVPNRIATHTTTLRVRLHVQELIIPLHSTLQPQGKNRQEIHHLLLLLESGQKQEQGSCHS